MRRRRPASEAQLPTAAPIEPEAPLAEPLEEPEVPRKDRLLAAARKLLEELSGYDLSTVEAATDLLELGLDSLLLTQAATLFQRKFGVSITFRQLMEELSSLEAIASHLDAVLPPAAFAAAPSFARRRQPFPRRFQRPVIPLLPFSNNCCSNSSSSPANSFNCWAVRRLSRPRRSRVPR